MPQNLQSPLEIYLLNAIPLGQPPRFFCSVYGGLGLGADRREQKLEAASQMLGTMRDALV